MSTSRRQARKVRRGPDAELGVVVDHALLEAQPRDIPALGDEVVRQPRVLFVRDEAQTLGGHFGLDVDAQSLSVEGKVAQVEGLVHGRLDAQPREGRAVRERRLLDRLDPRPACEDLNLRCRIERLARVDGPGERGDVEAAVRRVDPGKRCQQEAHLDLARSGLRQGGRGCEGKNRREQCFQPDHSQPPPQCIAPSAASPAPISR